MYVGSDEKIHFVDKDGADSALPFNKGTDTSDATATPDNITVGYTAYVNGVKITGTRAAPSTYQSGYYVTELLSKNQSATYRIDFPKPFVSRPAVTVSSDNGNIRMSVSGTPDIYGFSVYCINTVGSAYRAGCTWKATGTVAD